MKPIRNRRPRLKREPVDADRVAEVVREVADNLGIRVSVRVILYKRGRDLVLVCSRGRADELRESVLRKVMELGIDGVTTNGYDYGAFILLSID